MEASAKQRWWVEVERYVVMNKKKKGYIFSPFPQSSSYLGFEHTNLKDYGLDTADLEMEQK